MIKVQANSDLRVAVNGRRWVFNPHCLSHAPGEIPLEETTGKHSVDHTVILLLVTHTALFQIYSICVLTQSDKSHFCGGRICFQDFMWMCVGLQIIPLRKDLEIIWPNLTFSHRHHWSGKCSETTAALSGASGLSRCCVRSCRSWRCLHYHHLPTKVPQWGTCRHAHVVLHTYTVHMFCIHHFLTIKMLSFDVVDSSKTNKLMVCIMDN